MRNDMDLQEEKGMAVEQEHAPALKHNASAEDNEQHVRVLIRKIDWALMPIMCTTYALQYYDKVILGHAAIFGLIADLDLNKTPLGYSNVSMIFYCGYLLGAFPASYLTQRYPTGKVCGIMVVIWSAIVLSTIGCTGYRTLLVNRFFLGFVESGIAPSFMLVVSMWYTRKDQLLRSGLWYSFSGGANIFVPAISYGISFIPEGRLASWQYMYLIVGAITFLWSFVIFFWFPDSPENAKKFNAEEKELLYARMKEDNAGQLEQKFKVSHVIECLGSLQFWSLNLLSMLTSVTSGPISSFGSVIFVNMGFTSSQALLLNMPNGLLAFLCILGSARIGMSYQNIRLYLVLLSCPVVVMGCALVWKLPATNMAGRVAGFYLMNFFSAAYIQILGLGTSNVGGYTKKATVSAGIFVFYCVGSIIGPLMFSQKDAPRYNGGFMGVMICLAAAFVIAIALRIYLARKNASRDREYGSPGAERGLEDITDRENKDFRYLL